LDANVRGVGGLPDDDSFHPGSGGAAGFRMWSKGE
jgi:hypothetical protein